MKPFTGGHAGGCIGPHCQISFVSYLFFAFPSCATRSYSPAIYLLSMFCIADFCVMPNGWNWKETKQRWPPTIVNGSWRARFCLVIGIENQRVEYRPDGNGGVLRVACLGELLGPHHLPAISFFVCSSLPSLVWGLSILSLSPFVFVTGAIFVYRSTAALFIASSLPVIFIKEPGANRG